MTLHWQTEVGHAVAAVQHITATTTRP